MHFFPGHIPCVPALVLSVPLLTASPRLASYLRITLAFCLPSWPLHSPARLFSSVRAVPLLFVSILFSSPPRQSRSSFRCTMPIAVRFPSIRSHAPADLFGSGLSPSNAISLGSVHFRSRSLRICAEPWLFSSLQCRSLSFRLRPCPSRFGAGGSVPIPGGAFPVSAVPCLCPSLRFGSVLCLGASVRSLTVHILGDSRLVHAVPMLRCSRPCYSEAARNLAFPKRI